MRNRFLLLICALTLSACSTTGGPAVFRREIGTASLRDAIDLGIRVSRHHQFEFETIDSIPDMRIETRWKRRNPFRDEIDLGITEAQSRMVLTARRRGATNIQGIYAVHLTMENRVTADGSQWSEASQTPEFLAWATEIVNEYKQLILNIAVRRH